jgi:hypothetical protein
MLIWFICDFSYWITDLPQKFRIRFSDIGEHETVHTAGMPFVILAKCELHCLYGKDKNKKKKEDYQASRTQELSVRIILRHKDLMILNSQFWIPLWDLMRLYISRSRVATYVAHKRTFTAKSTLLDLTFEQ